MRTKPGDRYALRNAGADVTIAGEIRITDQDVLTVPPPALRAGGI